MVRFRGRVRASFVYSFVIDSRKLSKLKVQLISQCPLLRVCGEPGVDLVGLNVATRLATSNLGNVKFNSCPRSFISRDCVLNDMLKEMGTYKPNGYRFSYSSRNALIKVSSKLIKKDFSVPIVFDYNAHETLHNVNKGQADLC